MAGNTYQLVVDAVYKGGGAFQQAQGDLSGLDRAAKGAGAGLSSNLAKVGIAFGAVSLAVTGVAVAAGKAYSVLREGAALTTTQQRFEKLAGSINTTADSLLGKLRAATKGMISDMSLMESASGIVSLRLAENEDQVIRLATVVGTLGWDMQQVILTFANLSTMRLDALGLSVEEVKNKQHELMQQGMTEAQAFKEAVIQAGEARLEVGGVSETEEAFKKAESAATNFKNALLLSTVATLEQAGAFDQLSNAATRMSLVQQITELDTKLRETGKGAELLGSNFARSNELSTMTTAQLAVEVERLKNIIAGLDPVVQNGSAGWRQYGVITGMALMGIENELDVLRYLAGETTVAVAQGAAAMAGAVTDAQATIIAGYIGNADAIRQYNREQGNAVSSNVQLYRVMSSLGGKMQEVEEATYSFGSAISAIDLREQSLIATHSRMAAAFDSEAFGDAAAGLIDASGAANVDAMNKALYDQAKAAGATAGQLALLGVATGALTEDQARAALKAAVLTEQARKLAMAVVAGQMGFGEAAAGMITFGAELDTQAAGQSLETLATAADGFAESVYEAELAVDNEAANLGLTASIDLINEFEGTHVANMVTTYSTTGGTSSPTGGGPMGGTSGAAGGNGTTTNSLEDDGKSRRYGRSATRNAGADLLPYGGGSVYPDRRSAEVYTNYHGGSTVNVTVTNYVDGRQVGRDNLDDITEDSIKRAMAELGLGRR